ncbi:DUF2474 domain-containing protein [Phaeobacter gallaeciensis]|uniref:DUF2474 domain-containing protein n=1 Tax=Phaeobacter gallaeciensis TaxID=60890 RepID=A0AAC9Z8N4_9RHOB|nr:DUF2474 domain-containing protein [Phaeobacter gallaeciensis]AHD09227.1 hypothetical protein Gal_01465 [Phaeobacter gallaeciensis DSM 26640]ATE92490.1 hypothetical protein PhaeoP11_01456 [Phaeobacter gallaeciensis]ATE97688.1 hypothetical protein PhaeoP73_02390 [Phaeobacter gallaeciensis]ATF01155.1 hypothetical protein PhaeoP75_01506 [Phaeobacter gallaeciensis]ATF05535.1 hypothetical protein PhaeoP63_01454 [Phaeobacter gallaeciensis]
MQGKPAEPSPARQAPQPEPGARRPVGRLLWFAAIWIASVAILGCVAYVIRWAVVP